MKMTLINTLINKLLNDLQLEAELVRASRTQDEKHEHMERIIVMHTVLVALAEKRRQAISWFWLIDKFFAWRFEMEVKTFHNHLLRSGIA